MLLALADGLNIEASRTPFISEADERESKDKNRHAVFGTQHGGNAVYGDFAAGGTRADYNPPGRWPSNLLLTIRVRLTELKAQLAELQPDPPSQYVLGVYAALDEVVRDPANGAAQDVAVSAVTLAQDRGQCS